MFNFYESIFMVDEAVSMITLPNFLVCTLVSLVLGFAIAKIYTYKSSYSRSFVVTLAMLPAIVQVVIMLVNGNLGTSVAVMGTFSLVRFRSIPGTAKEIGSIFLAMAIGLATGMGYITIALLFTLIIGIVSFIYEMTEFGKDNSDEQDLKITIPEDLYTTEIFDDIFKKYTSDSKLLRVKTTNMGTLFKLHYRVKLNKLEDQKGFLNAIRCRNGNLEIIYGIVSNSNDNL